MTEELQFLASRVRIAISGAQTGGAFALLEATAPAGDRPPLHLHLEDDEGFYVLEGELTLWIGDERHVLQAGDGMLAPKRVPHTLRVGDGGARYLVASAPAGFEAFVRAVAAADPDPAQLNQLAAEHGIEILGPPGMLPSDLPAARAA
jgi:mannose-6-phosphate isomerase-like protein (cupin superfamily)